MKKLLFSLFLLLHIAVGAQTKVVVMPTKYEVAVRFNSICCGPPAADFLKNFVKRFNYENKLTITAFHKGGCGKEGEFYILFSLSNIKENLQTDFKKQLVELIPKANEETRLKNPDKGMVQFFSEINLSQLENCHSELISWDYTNN